MDLMKGELRSHLDPTALRILKKRLVSGKITPQVFKDILKRQMVKYFFQTYSHPFIKPWGIWRRLAKKRIESHATSTRPSPGDEFEMYHHKRF